MAGANTTAGPFLGLWSAGFMRNQRKTLQSFSWPRKIIFNFPLELRSYYCWCSFCFVILYYITNYNNYISLYAYP